VFALDPQALDGAAARIDAAAASLSCLDVTHPLRVAGEAVTGSATAAACGWTAAGVDAALDAWVAHLLDLADTARRVAGDAIATDDDVARILLTGAP